MVSDILGVGKEYSIVGGTFDLLSIIYSIVICISFRSSSFYYF